MYNKGLKIGVLGSGDVGRVLATAFIKEGHTVMLGTRDPLKDQVVKWKRDNSGGLAGTFSETAAFGEIVILATAGSVSLSVIEMAGKENFNNKLVIDTTNPIAPEPPVKGNSPLRPAMKAMADCRMHCATLPPATGPTFVRRLRFPAAQTGPPDLLESPPALPAVVQKKDPLLMEPAPQPAVVHARVEASPELS